MLNIFKKIKLTHILTAIFVSYLGFTSFVSADNYNSCIGNESCSSCMCEQIQEYFINECSNYKEECYESCEDEDCSMCEEDEGNCINDSYIQLDDCLMDKSVFIPNFDENGLNVSYGACYLQRLPGGGNEGGNEGGNQGGNNNGGILLSSGVDTFEPVVDGLKNSMNEFIPYVVYVGLGVLGALIGFFAIRRLINYVRGGTLSIFSSRKRK